MGGASLQGSSANTLNRDTQKFAFKASFIEVDGEARGVIKSPITDNGKRSKAGRLDLIKENEKYSTVVLSPQEEYHNLSVMMTIYKNGELLVNDNFETIRERVKL